MWIFAAKKANKPEEEPEEEDGGMGLMLPFWRAGSSSQDSSEDDTTKNENAEEDDSSSSRFFRFMGRRSSNSEDDKDDKKKEKKQLKKEEKKKKKEESFSAAFWEKYGKSEEDSKQNEEEKEEDQGGMLKSITRRFGSSAKKEEEKEEEPPPEEVIDMRPTFVQFKTSSPSVTRKIPKEGSKAMPIISTPSRSMPLKSSSPQQQKPQQQQKKQPVSSSKSVLAAASSSANKVTEPKRSKTLRIMQKMKGKSKNETATDDNEDGGSLSLFGQVQQRIFGDSSSNSTSSADNNQTKTSNTPGSVAQKFLYNVWESSSSKLMGPKQPKEEWVAVCPKTRITPGEIVPVEVNGLDLIVVASKDAQNIYCMVNSCPHLGTPLETGFLERRPMEVNENDTNNAPTGISGSLNGPTESDVAALLANDGCEDCIVCPLHKTAFALKSGQVRGEWCPYPPVLGKLMSTVKNSNSAAVFDVRIKGKNIEVRLNTPLLLDDQDDKKKKNKKDKKQ